MTSSGPNASLERLFRETGWTLERLAREVNKIATERGTPTKYGAPSAHQWLGGALPRESARSLILEALARALGRPITHSQAGFPDPVKGANEPAGAAEGLIDIGIQDINPSRRNVIGATLFSVALTVPDWPDVVGRMERVQTGQMQRIGMQDVDTVIAMTERISDLDDQFGGRHARPMAAAFLVNTVASYMRCEGLESVRKAMMSAASDLCYLTGYMAVGEGFHGLAQRYYLKALQLAGASEDHLTFCTTLRGMSVQAVDQGHGPYAVRLAAAAAAASPQAGPRMRAFLAGQQAHASAQVGDRKNALTYLREAEIAMEKAESQSKTFGSYNPSSLAYHIGQVRYELGDVSGSILALTESDKLRHTSFRRNRIRYLSILAERQLEIGHLEEACDTWGKVVEIYPHVKSGQCDEKISTMAKRISPYVKNRNVRALRERARVIAPGLVA